MRDDQKFEIERAFDLLPHVVGASWATVWYRLEGQKKPTRQEFRQKVAEYFEMLDPVFASYSGEKFEDISKYIAQRRRDETAKILAGENPEVEKRYDRYVDYG